MKQHDNPTSRFMESSALAGNSFDWLDLFPFMPRDGNAGLSLGLLERYLLDNLENGKDWLHRIVSRVDEETGVGNLHPVLYITGKTCNKVWQTLEHSDHTIIDEVLGLHHYTTSAGSSFITVEGHTHPSHHLSSRGSVEAKATFRETMDLLSAVRKASRALIDAATTFEPRAYLAKVSQELS
jgi:hypothetical protein